MKRHRILYCFLCGMVFIAAMIPFVQVANYGLVNCDDLFYVGANSFVMNGVSVDAVKKALVDTSLAIWMPLTWISYMVDVEVVRGLGACGMPVSEAGVMHIHSVLIHGVDAVLLFVLLTRLLRGAPWWACAVAALAWAVHPLRCESVCWVASRKDVLSMCGLLVALICWVKFRMGTDRPIRWYVASLGCFLVGALAKPSVMTFVFIVFLFDWLVLHVVDPFELWRRRAEKGAEERMARALWMYALPLAGFVALGAFSGHVQAIGGATAELAGVPLHGRILNALAAFGIYVWHTFCPFGLCIQCLNRWPEMPRFLMPGILISAMVAGYLVWAFRSMLSGVWKREELKDGVLASVLLFCITIGPFLGLANFGYHAFADRFTYIPSLGVALAAALLLRSATRRGRLGYGDALCKVSMACGFVVVIALGAGAFHQTRYWANDEVLFQHVLEVEGERNSMAHLDLGEYYFEHPHDLQKAADHFSKVQKLSPVRLIPAAPYYIFTLCELKRVDEATSVLHWYAECLDKLRARPDVNNPFPQEVKPHFLYRLARVCVFALQKDLMAEAERELEELRHEHGDDIRFLYVKGWIAWEKGCRDEARLIWKGMRENDRTDDYIHFGFTKHR